MVRVRRHAVRRFSPRVGISPQCRVDASRCMRKKRRFVSHVDARATSFVETTMARALQPDPQNGTCTRHVEKRDEAHWNK